MKKTLTMVLALVLVFALGVGGTLAWLSATTTVPSFSPFCASSFASSLVDVTRLFRMIL